MWSKLGIRKKTLLLFFVISVFPLMIINVFWLRSAQNQLQRAAAERQSILLSGLARRINDSLDSQINRVVSMSEDVDVATLDSDGAKVSLLQYASQDSDVVRVAVADRSGNERTVVEDGRISENKINIKDSDAFAVVTFVSNKAYVSDIKVNNNQPEMTISVPIFNLTSELGQQDLTANEALTRRFGGDIIGAIIVTVKLNSIWDEVSRVRLGDDGYAYLIDENGGLLVHPDASFKPSADELTNIAEVQEARRVLGSFDLETTAERYQPSPEVTRSEKKQQVLSSSFPISSTKWSVIGQEPVASVYRAANRATVSAFVIFMVSVPVAFFLVLFATRTIITPIRLLTEGAIRLSSGDFSRPIKAEGTDEISVLAQAFNSMGRGVQSLLKHQRTQNFSLAAEQTKLQAVLDTIADGVIALDQHHNIVLTNKTMASLVGVQSQKALLGRPWLSTLQLFYEGEPFSDELVSSDLAFYHDVEMRVRDEQKYLDITAVRILNDPNGIVFILTVQDTTPRRELENMKLDFVSMAAHELRTPLTAISGYLKLIGDPDSSNDEKNSFVKVAISNANMLEGLINNMLALSRIERNALVVHRKQINWSDVVREEVQSLQFMASSRSIQLELYLPEAPLFIWGDDIALREVLANLINNAIHYSEDNQKVVVKAEMVGADVKTTVSDHGIGIPDRLKEKLFTKYYRAKGGLATNSQGTGIGLFISKSIIEAHGGIIGFDSTFGQGSDFYFMIAAYNKQEHRQEDLNGVTMSTHGHVDWFEHKSPEAEQNGKDQKDDAA